MIPAFARQHVTRTGAPKVAYEYEGKARAVAAANRMHTYQCSLCGQWHLTSAKVKTGQKRPTVPWYGDVS